MNFIIKFNNYDEKYSNFGLKYHDGKYSLYIKMKRKSGEYNYTIYEDRNLLYIINLLPMQHVHYISVSFIIMYGTMLGLYHDVDVITNSKNICNFFDFIKHPKISMYILQYLDKSPYWHIDRQIFEYLKIKGDILFPDVK